MLFKGRGNKQGLFNLRPIQILALGMLGFIALGTILLMLPISSSTREVTSFINALFTATSAACVTGLTVVDTGTHWSLFGEIVIILLVQIGGIGFMTFSTLIVVLLGKKVSLKERLIVMEAYNAFNIQGLVKLVLYVIGITFAIEGVGAAILTTQFMQEYTLGKSIYYGIFHSISAFCNGGFDLFGDFMGYTGYVTNTIVSSVIGILIVIGGLGFYVITEIINHNHKKKRRYSLHTRVVIIMTFTLIIVGTILFFILEYNNPKTMGNLPLSHKVTASIFASITPRSGGISTVSKADMTSASQFLTVVLMFIGASPGSTGGGIKTTTLMILISTISSVVRGREDVEIFRKRISTNLVYRAVSITLINFLIISFVTIVLAVTQKGTFMQFLYEATSAFGTVGLSLGITPSLTLYGKIAIILSMYIGRVGALSLVFAFAYKHKVSKNSIRYPEDKIIVG